MKKLKSPHIALWMIGVFHLIGFAGMAFTEFEWIIGLTPFNLLLTAALIMVSDGQHEQLLRAGITVAVLGFGIELIGVNTGWPFGTYSYGETLGWKLLGTPLIIGVNWFILMYAVQGIALRLGRRTWLIRLIAGALMVLLDTAIEPVAIALGYWSWERIEPPFTNYIAWFFISAVFSAIWQWIGHRPRLMMSLGVFIIQCLFFLGLMMGL